MLKKLVAVTTAKIPKSIRQEKFPKPNSQDDVAARTTVAAVEPLSSYKQANRTTVSELRTANDVVIYSELLI
ncbi:hypothetical protein L3X38_021775 [Prunus dulcis]|uniref:Uncharacterized protein n=1 Tax=Prunus dulcis TaxID=3755 RepID=A0AAD4VUP6_PRUDU|nr:hypothetical protein L3X38_021775 [Prunus dulcis]